MVSAQRPTSAPANQAGGEKHAIRATRAILAVIARSVQAGLPPPAAGMEPAPRGSGGADYASARIGLVRTALCVRMAMPPWARGAPALGLPVTSPVVPMGSALITIRANVTAVGPATFVTPAHRAISAAAAPVWHVPGEPRTPAAVMGPVIAAPGPAVAIWGTLEIDVREDARTACGLNMACV